MYSAVALLPARFLICLFIALVYPSKALGANVGAGKHPDESLYWFIQQQVYGWGATKWEIWVVTLFSKVLWRMLKAGVIGRLQPSLLLFFSFLFSLPLLRFSPSLSFPIHQQLPRRLCRGAVKGSSLLPPAPCQSAGHTSLLPVGSTTANRSIYLAFIGPLARLCARRKHPLRWNHRVQTPKFLPHSHAPSLLRSCWFNQRSKAGSITRTPLLGEGEEAEVTGWEASEGNKRRRVD